MKATTRSGHATQDLNNLLHYVLQCHRVQIDSGKLVAGWESLHDPCLPPSSRHIITPENKELIYALVRHLFNTRWNIFDSHLRYFVLTMFACLLKSLPEMIAEYGEGTLVNVVIQKALRKFKIGKNTVNGWIMAIQKGWEDDNISSLTTNIVLRKEIKDLHSEIIELKKEAIKSNALQIEILNLLKNMNLGTISSNDGGSNSGDIVQLSNEKNLSPNVNTAENDDVIENAFIEGFATTSDICDDPGIDSVEGPCIASVKGHGIGTVGFLLSGVADADIAPGEFVCPRIGSYIAPIDSCDPGVEPDIAPEGFDCHYVGHGIVPVSDGVVSINASDESLHVDPFESGMLSGNGNSLGLTVFVDRAIGKDNNTVTKKKNGRGKGKCNKNDAKPAKKFQCKLL